MRIETSAMQGTLEIKADRDRREVEGYGSVFEVVDSKRDRVKPGAFAATIEEKMSASPSQIKLLWQHSEPLGSVQALSEDDKGLYFKARVSRTARGDEALTLVEDDVVNGASIGYRATRWEIIEEDNQPPVRELHEIELFEISLVTWPANQEAYALRAKSLLGMAEDLRRGSLTVEELEDLERAYDLMSRLLESQRSRLGSSDRKPAPEPEPESESNCDPIAELKELLESIRQTTRDMETAR